MRFFFSHKEHSFLTVIILLAVVVFVGLAYTVKPTLSQEELQHLFATHDQTFIYLQEYEYALFLPGSESNTDRQNLNNILEEILTTDMSGEERVGVIETGIRHLSVVQRQVAEIKKKEERFEEAIMSFEQSLSPLSQYDVSFFQQDTVLFREHLKTAQPIPGFLDDMNNAIEDIFLSLMKEGGELSEEFILKLNEDIPNAEKTFDSLSFTYQDIIEAKENITEHRDMYDQSSSD